MPGTGRSSIKSRVVRVTALDEAGTPLVAPATCISLVTTGYTNIAISHEFEDGEEVTQKNTWGELCISYKSPDALKNAGVAIEFCAVHPDILSMMASMVPIENATDVVIGGAITDDIGSGGFAIETWTAITPPTVGGGGSPLWLYWVFLLRPGRLSDFTMEEGPLLITVESSTVASTGAWGDGSYIATTNPLLDESISLPDGTHWAYIETEIQPPAATAGCGAIPTT